MSLPLFDKPKQIFFPLEFSFTIPTHNIACRKSQNCQIIEIASNFLFLLSKPDKKPFTHCAQCSNTRAYPKRSSSQAETDYFFRFSMAIAISISLTNGMNEKQKSNLLKYVKCLSSYLVSWKTVTRIGIKSISAFL